MAAPTPPTGGAPTPPAAPPAGPPAPAPAAAPAAPATPPPTPAPAAAPTATPAAAAASPTNPPRPRAPPAPAVPAWYTAMSTPAKGCLISGLAALGLGILVTSTFIGTRRSSPSYESNYTYDESTNSHKYTFPTGIGKLEYTVDSNAYQPLMRAVALAEAHVGRQMDDATKQKFFVLADVDKSGNINQNEAVNYAPDIARRVLREQQD